MRPTLTRKNRLSKKQEKVPVPRRDPSPLMYRQSCFDSRWIATIGGVIVLRALGDGHRSELAGRELDELYVAGCLCRETCPGEGSPPPDIASHSHGPPRFCRLSSGTG